ncbi:head maturation protease, ClpP-related [Mongoliimonas terrestris]|uniref:head maturation protease, ClpP-related n=1 Tax=Mongoliimonas terrestris TaxID=1709001 RepID=UPI0009495E8E|nr:head maturation protease, ClpP-related [Mongoliimonas terrestris]
MSLRHLPEIKALDSLSDDLSPVPADKALARWKPGIHAATEGDAGVISIYDVIGEDFWTGEGVTSKRVAAALRSIGGRDVTVNVNSPGGDFFEGIAIYNLLREHPHKVTVKVMGLAASAASIIAMAGDQIQISEIGFLMVHNAWAVAVGNRHDMREAAETLEPFDDAMASLYASRSGVKKTEAAAWMDKETWFNGSQAIDAGLADELLPSAEIEERADTGAKSLAAVRRIDAALARANPNMTRSERKSVIADLKGGMPGAAANAMPGAGELEADLRRLIMTLTN